MNGNNYTNWSSAQASSSGSFHSSALSGAEPSSSHSWVQESGYQTDRSGFGYRLNNDTKVLTSLDDKVANADAKLRDFMAEIESLDAETEAAHEENDKTGLPRTQLPGFISAGHVLPADNDVVADDTQPALVDQLPSAAYEEPTTTWQHLLDPNTQHYYYWNTETNEVTWTIPAEYTEYLLKHKQYIEKLESGKISVTEVKKSVDKKETNDEGNSVMEEEDKPHTELIGPQLPASLNTQPVKFQQTPATNLDEKTTSSKQLDSEKTTLSLVGYNSDDSEAEEQANVENSLVGVQIKGATKSLVADYDVNNDEQNTELEGEESLDLKVDSSSISNDLTQGQHRGDSPLENTQNAEARVDDTVEHYDEGIYYNTAESNEPLNFTESMQYYQETPLIFTKPPPPPPEPAPVEEKENGLSSVEISDYYSVISDKLHFLDITTDDISKLQMLIIQLKTRLDDWQAGGLNKEYLVEKIEEMDQLLEVCEMESSPPGWKCVWSHKEKQYYYIHEITEEISWSYPTKDTQNVIKLASSAENNQNKGKYTKVSGTLAPLSQALHVKTVDASLKSLFARKIMEKFLKVDDPNNIEESMSLSCAPIQREDIDLSEHTNCNRKHKRKRSKDMVSSPKRRRHHHSELSSDESDTEKKDNKSSDRIHKERRKHKHSSSSKKKKSKHKKHKNKKSHKPKSESSDRDLIEVSSDTEVIKSDNIEPNITKEESSAPVVYNTTPEDTKLVTDCPVLSPSNELKRKEFINISNTTSANSKVDHTVSTVISLVSTSPTSPDLENDIDGNMDISPIPSGVTTPINDLQSVAQEKISVTEPSAVTVESIDDFLLAIERETKPQQELTNDEDTTPKQVIIHAAPPVLYKQETSSTNLPTCNIAADSAQTALPRESKPAQGEATKVTDATVALKPHKEKEKSKKSSKKTSSKMPSALVQKWQKVQNEITAETSREKKMREMLLK